MANTKTIGDLTLVTSLSDQCRLLIDDSTGGDTKAALLGLFKQYCTDEIKPWVNQTTGTWFIGASDTGVEIGKIDVSTVMESLSITPEAVIDPNSGTEKIRLNANISQDARNILTIEDDKTIVDSSGNTTLVEGGLLAKNPLIYIDRADYDVLTSYDNETIYVVTDNSNVNSTETSLYYEGVKISGDKFTDSEGTEFADAMDAYLLVDITPSMTSNTTPSPYEASASSEYSSSWLAYQAFDGDDTVYWCSGNSDVTGWLMFDFSVRTKIRAFSIQAPKNSAYAQYTPKYLTFQGSNDGMTFYDLLDVNETTDYSSNEIRTFHLDKVYNYRYYRVNITQANATSSTQEYSYINQINFYKAVPNMWHLTTLDKCVDGNTLVKVIEKLQASITDIELSIDTSSPITISTKDGNAIETVVGTSTYTDGLYVKDKVLFLTKTEYDNLGVYDDSVIYIVSDTTANGADVISLYNKGITISVDLLDDTEKQLLMSVITNKFQSALTDVTPIMTSDTTPAPYVVTCNSIYSSYNPYKAFNGTLLNSSSDMWTFVTKSNWIQLDFNKTTRISAFDLSAPNYNYLTYVPKDFTLQGSNDGITFDDIMYITDETNWSIAETRRFTLPNPVNYRYYRLTDFTNNGGATYTRIGQIRFLGESLSNIFTNGDKVVSSEVLLTSLQCLYDTMSSSTSINDSEKAEYLDALDNTVLEDITPSLTSNTEPSPYNVFSNISNNTNAYKVFDSSNTFAVPAGSYWKTGESYITLDFGENTRVERVAIGAYSVSGSNNPKVSTAIRWFKVEGSYDNVNFYPIIERTNETSWTSLEVRYFDFDKVCNYRYYKVTPLNNNGNSSLYFCKIRYFGYRDVYDLVPKTTFSRLSDVDTTFQTAKSFDPETFRVSPEDSELLAKCIDTKKYLGKYDEIKLDLLDNTTLPPFVASASSIYASDDAYCVFDTSSSYWKSGTYALSRVPQWVQIDLGEKRYVDMFSIRAVHSTTGYKYAPKDFVIQGSNDGVNFITLVECTDQSTWETATSNTLYYELDRTAYYRYYRLSVTAVNDGSSSSSSTYTIVQQFSFFYGNTELNNVDSSKYIDVDTLMKVINAQRTNKGVQEVIWEGSQSSTGDISLLNSLDEYSSIVVTGCVYDSVNNEIGQITSTTIHKCNLYTAANLPQGYATDGAYLLNLTTDSDSRRIVFDFTDNYTLKVSEIINASLLSIVGIY